MKKILGLILAALMMVTMFAACSDEADVEEAIEKYMEDGMDEFAERAEKIGDMNLENCLNIANTPLSDSEYEELEQYVQTKFKNIMERMLESVSYEIKTVEIDGDTAIATLETQAEAPDMYVLGSIESYFKEAIEDMGYSYYYSDFDFDVAMEALSIAFDEVDASFETKEGEKELKLEKEDGEWVVNE
ncbi:MAG: hypothetical protein E7473_10730 [Ruminococcaceae bacterium]|nr:hypothetical protein [Oscillospiraceae bacterium]